MSSLHCERDLFATTQRNMIAQNPIQKPTNQIPEPNSKFKLQKQIYILEFKLMVQSIFHTSSLSTIRRL